MPKKSRLPQSRHHIMCYDVVWSYFESRFGPSGVQPVGVSTVIRELLYKQYLTWAEAENRQNDNEARSERSVTATRI